MPSRKTIEQVAQLALATCSAQRLLEAARATRHGRTAEDFVVGLAEKVARLENM